LINKCDCITQIVSCTLILNQFALKHHDSLDIWSHTAASDRQDTVAQFYTILKFTSNIITPHEITRYKTKRQVHSDQNSLSQNTKTEAQR
jgi:hypothetical protein